MRPYDAWTEEEASLCAVVMFAGLVFGIWYFLEVLNGKF